MTEKEKELNGYLEEINNILLFYFLVDTHVPTRQDLKRIMDVIEEWSDKN